MNISFRISVLLIMLFAIIAPRCHALSDFAGQGKAPLTWSDLMQPRVDPSRYFATPGGGHGVHPAGGYDAPQAKAKAKPDKPAEPEVKPEVKPPMPHIPLVPAPKPQPEVKPEPKPDVKPDCKPKPKPEAKPEPHKCLPFHFRPVKHDCTPKPDCKHETARPDKKPSCSKGVVGLKGSMPGMKGRGLGHSRGGHHGGKCGKGRR